MTTHMIEHAHRQQAQRLMRLALLRVAGIAGLIVLLALVDCAALLVDGRHSHSVAALDANAPPAHASAVGRPQPSRRSAAA